MNTKLYNFVLTIIAGFFFLVISCATIKNRTEIKDTFQGSSKKWKVSILIDPDLKVEKKIQTDSCCWIYGDDKNRFELALIYSSDNFINNDVSQLDFCKQNLESRQYVFGANRPCSDQLKSKIVRVNNMDMIFTESYCSAEKDIKFELFTLFDNSELSIVICFYNSANKVEDFEKYRQEVRLIYNSIKIE